ncbi:hypothetical protein MIND_00212200 [Mycena indigotica]|uniref:Uncharacterized protein n=1 Tax=Mycena indigotica TaxID=2126181 RepID=A0A8H6WEM2_9AGAR|nr:uncharacterized protein MIND_00212200 [Mycena indigotica]KAF7312003.1 hypothetical protein MIND_00212200 [Mycena indigotica]
MPRKREEGNPYLGIARADRALVRTLRTAHGWSLRRIADAVGSSASSVGCVARNEPGDDVERDAGLLDRDNLLRKVLAGEVNPGRTTRPPRPRDREVTQGHDDDDDDDELDVISKANPTGTPLAPDLLAFLSPLPLDLARHAPLFAAYQMTSLAALRPLCAFPAAERSEALLDLFLPPFRWHQARDDIAQLGGGMTHVEIIALDQALDKLAKEARPNAG